MSEEDKINCLSNFKTVELVHGQCKLAADCKSTSLHCSDGACAQ